MQEMEPCKRRVLDSQTALESVPCSGQSTQGHHYTFWTLLYTVYREQCWGPQTLITPLLVQSP